jgi:isopentenyldiphosphate isomerase
MEQLEIVHEHNGQPTGEILPRNEALAREAWCRSTNVFIMNSRGEILCHKRSMQKERLPGAWYTHLGGHVGVGETCDSNALKEVMEEAGIEITADQLVKWRTTKADGPRLWMHDYVALIDAPVEAFTPQPGEVDEFRWVSFDEIIANKENYPDVWYPGYHGFKAEYECIRSALVAAHHLGAIEVPEELHGWAPGLLLLPA